MSKKNPDHTFPSKDFEFSFGSHTDCKIRFQGWPEFAASLKRRGDRLYIRDFGGYVTINDNNIRKKRYIEITRYDVVKVCGTKINLDPRAFLGRDNVDLNSSELSFVLPDGKILCEKLYIRAESGSLTAIMGPSGAGKSVFINLLNGYNAPTKGRIRIDNFDLQEDFENIREYIGYVPQDEVMIPELTLRQSLKYRLRLRYPDMDADTVNRLIRSTCLSLGLQDDVLDTQIGSPESGIRGLSGGQKKRANIAHELILKPLILILDEPTSGLSSVDADQVVKLLSDLAKQSCITVIATIHQPSRDAFGLFDDLLLISSGGKTAYYGKAQKAVEYFDGKFGVPYRKENPPEYILGLLNDLFLVSAQSLDKIRKEKIPSPVMQKIDSLKNRGYIKENEFLADMKNAVGENEILPYYEIVKKHCLVPKDKSRSQTVSEFEKTIETIRRGIRTKDADFIYDADQSIQTGGAGNPKSASSKPHSIRNIYYIYRQWMILLLRNLNVFFKDRKNLYLLLGQVPVIAFLIIVSFHNFEKDNYELDTFARRMYHVGKETEGKRGVRIDALWQNSYDIAQKGNAISEFGSRYRGAIYYVLIAAAIWFGIIGSCKEIVTEQHILKRELRSCVYPLPCLSAKFAMLVLIVGFQTGVLTAFVPLLVDLSPMSLVLLWLILWTAAVASSAIGLCLSCFSSSSRFVLTFVPIVLIFQLIFGGLMRPSALMEKNPDLFRFFGSMTIQQFFSSLTIQRWAFESALAVDVYGTENVLEQELATKKTEARIINELSIIKYKESSMLHSFFPSREKSGEIIGRFCSAFHIKTDKSFVKKVTAVIIPLLYVFMMISVFFVISYLKLTQRFIAKK